MGPYEMAASRGAQDAESYSFSLDSPQFPGWKTMSITPPTVLRGELIKTVQILWLFWSESYEGLWTRPDGEQVSVIIKNHPTWTHGNRSERKSTEEERINRHNRREIRIWNAIHHDNILQFIGYQVVKDGPPLLVSPRYKNGDLLKYIKANPGVTYAERLTLLRDAVRGLAYLHNLTPPIAHGSIHPTAIFVTDDVRGVLGEFGNSRVTTHSHPDSTTDTPPSGWFAYMAVELLKEGTTQTPMSDVYGLGGTILCTMTGKDPFHKKRTQPSIIAAIVTGVTPSTGDHSELPESDPLWRLMSQCWDGEPSRRPTAAQTVYKINLILDLGHGLTAPFRPTLVASSGPPDPESGVQPEEVVPPLPSPLAGTLTREEVIGGGGYGEVHRGYWKPPGKDPIPVAIKCLKFNNTGPDKARYHVFIRRRIRRETVIWKAAEHSNILRFYGYQLADESPMLVSSWCKNGDLWSFLEENPQLTRKERLVLLSGAGRGLAHLHSLQPPICHGDIKPQNIIIGDNMDALLCDFGVSRIITDPGVAEMTTYGAATGTAGFGAKEILEGLGPTEKGDVYAFGGLILATMTGKRPFYTKRNHNLITVAIFANETPNPADYPQISSMDPLWTLMKRCWDPEPDQRPTVNQILGELQKEIDLLSNGLP